MGNSQRHDMKTPHRDTIDNIKTDKGSIRTEICRGNSQRHTTQTEHAGEREASFPLLIIWSELIWNAPLLK